MWCSLYLGKDIGRTVAVTVMQHSVWLVKSCWNPSQKVCECGHSGYHGASTVCVPQMTGWGWEAFLMSQLLTLEEEDLHTSCDITSGHDHNRTDKLVSWSRHCHVLKLNNLWESERNSSFSCNKGLTDISWSIYQTHNGLLLRWVFKNSLQRGKCSLMMMYSCPLINTTMFSFTFCCLCVSLILLYWFLCYCNPSHNVALIDILFCFSIKLWFNWISEQLAFKTVKSINILYLYCN